MLSLPVAEKEKMFRKLSEKLFYTQCVPEGLSGTHVFLSLGSNLGDRKKYLEEALACLQESGFFLLKVSSVYETSPVGCEDGAGAFYNIAAEGIWQKEAHALLAVCQNIEQKLGRPADHAHWVSRVVDIDIILFGEEKIHTPVLVIPHPLAVKRRFVMEPLAQIAAELFFPGSCKKIGEISKELV